MVFFVLGMIVVTYTKLTLKNEGARGRDGERQTETDRQRRTDGRTDKDKEEETINPNKECKKKDMETAMSILCLALLLVSLFSG